MRPKQNNLDFWNVLHESIPKSNQWVVPRERSWTFCESAMSVISMYLHEIIFRVQNWSFHEIIISDNTERRSLKLTRCSCWKKVHEMENLSAKECWNTKENLGLSWSFLLPNLRSGVLCLFSSVRGGLDPIAIKSNHQLGNPPYTLMKRLLANWTDLRSGVLCLFSSVRGGLDPIAIKSNHLLGNPPYTLMKRLLANWTDLRFVSGFCLAFKNGFESVYINFSPKPRSNSRTLLPGLNSRQFPAVSESC